MGTQGGTAMKGRPERNVTLGLGDGRDSLGKPFPCPVCNMELRLKISLKQKPYCTCLECGIQIFFRGQTGIKRLYKIVESEEAVSAEFSGPARAISLFNRQQAPKTAKRSFGGYTGVFLLRFGPGKGN